MAFKNLFIKEESAPPKQPIVAQEVAPNAESVMPSQSAVGKKFINGNKNINKNKYYE